MAPKKITIYDIAEACGVSYATVSRTLNGHGDVNAETKKRIKAKCDELGYHPSVQAKGLAKNKSWLVGVVFEALFENPFWAPWISSLRETLEARGYELIFLSPKSTNGSIMDRVRSRGLEALVVASVIQDSPEIQALNDVDMPIVTVNFRLANHSAVISQHYEGLHGMLEYLWRMGHRRIGFVVGNLNSTSARFRLNAYRKFLEERGIPYDASIVIQSEFTERATKQSYDGTVELIRKGHLPTAFCCSYDLMAIGVSEALQDYGYKVPEDVSVTGFDDIEGLEFFRPRMTTVKQNRRELGRLAAEEIISKLEREDMRIRTIPVDTDLIIRDSVAAPRK